MALRRLAAFALLAAARAELSEDLKALSTPKPLTEAQLQEMKQDFIDVDFNKDDIMDAQEVRAHFKGGISNLELNQFFIDSDKDMTGSITLQEYVSYAALLN